MAKKRNEPRIKLVEVLEKKKITKYRFALMLGVSTAVVTNYFNKGLNPTFNTLVRWAKVLDCKVADLIDE